MSGLVLKMSPKERVLINGAVLENGPRRSRFSIITPSAHVLRLKDAIHPDEANTPVGRLCYELQLILSGHSDHATKYDRIAYQLDKLRDILRDPFCQDHLQHASRAIAQGRIYSALKSIKALLPIERELLSYKIA